MPVTPIDVDAMERLGIVVNTSETRTDRYGEWNPLTVANTSTNPLLELPADKVDSRVAASWSTMELTSAYAVASRYLVEEHIDSELLWDCTESAKARFIERTADRYFNDNEWWRSRVESSEDLPYAPMPVDMDHEDWRENGLPGAAAGVVPPHTPLTYHIGEPRVDVRQMELTSVDVASDADPYPSFAYEISYRIPVEVDGISKPVWEATNTSIKIDLVKTDAWHVGGIELEADREVMATVEGGWRALTPLPAPKAVKAGWVPRELGGMTVSLPPEWIETADEPGEEVAKSEQTLVFEVSETKPEDSDEIWKPRAVLRVGGSDWSLDSEWELRCRTHSYSVDNAGAQGGVSISEYGDHDAVSFDLIGRHDGAYYELSANVPAGTGDELARQIVASMVFS